MNLDEIKLKMQQAQDRANAEHFAKTSPDVKNITGVRIPYMRKLAKEIAKGDTKYFLDNYNIETHEEFLLKGIVILSSKFSLEEKFAYLEKYVPEIYDWSGCDVLVSTLKCKDDELHLVYDFIMKYRYSKNEYETRFMIVMLFNFLNLIGQAIALKQLILTMILTVISILQRILILNTARQNLNLKI